MARAIYAVAEAALAEADAQADADDDAANDIFAVATAAAATVDRSAADTKHNKWVARSRQAADKRVAKSREALDAKVAKANTRATREVDVIKLDRQCKARGRGGYRRWTADGMLKAAFGNPPSRARRVKRVTRKKRRFAQRIAPMAASSRATARHMQAGQTHLQKIRNSVCCRIMDKQSEALDRVLASKHRLITLDIRLDETHKQMRLPAEAVREGIGPRVV